MRYTFIYYLILIPILFGCNQGSTFQKDLFYQNSFLLKKSFAFLEEEKNINFLNELNKFIKENPKYNFNNGRMEFVILHPLLLNNSQDKVVVLVLDRYLDLAGNRTEAVKLVLGQKQKLIWKFALNTRDTYSFSYAYSQLPTLSDQELTLRVLRIIVDKNYLVKNTNEINDDFFTGDFDYQKWINL